MDASLAMPQSTPASAPGLRRRMRAPALPAAPFDFDATSCGPLARRIPAFSSRQAVLTVQLIPSDKISDLLFRLSASASPPPRESSRRKSDRCTATRLIAPSARTSTTRQPLPEFRIT
jgi:hypothetical protein